MLSPLQAEHVPPYDVVPSMRPVVLVGPSLKGYEVSLKFSFSFFLAIPFRCSSNIGVPIFPESINLSHRIQCAPSKENFCVLVFANATLKSNLLTYYQ